MVAIGVPLFYFYIFRLRRAHDVDQAKAVSFVDADVWSVFVGREYERCFTRYQKINACNVVSFHEDVLVIAEELGPEKGTQPGDKGCVLSSKDLQLVVALLVDVERHFDLQFVGQILHEVIQILYVLLVLISETLLEAHVEVEG